MKSKGNSKLIFFVLILGMLYAALLIFVSHEVGQDQPDYTIFSNKEKGMSLLSDTLIKMGYPVKPSSQSIQFQTDINSLQIVVEPNPSYFNQELLDDALTWVRKGGQLFYLVDNDLFQIRRALQQEYFLRNENFIVYQCGKGVVVLGKSSDFTNETLMNNTHAAELLVEILEFSIYDTIVFNEYYHGFQNEPSYFKQLPPVIQITAFHLLVVSLFIVLSLGKRFGKPIPYFDENERLGNEYLLTLAAIYKKAGLGTVIVTSYYTHFLNISAQYFKTTPKMVDQSILQIWSEKKMENYEIVQKVHGFVHSETKLNSNRKEQKKQLMAIVQDINTLTKQVKNSFTNEYR